MKDLLRPSLQLDLIMFDKCNKCKLSVQNEMCQAWLVSILGNHGKLQSPRKTIELKAMMRNQRLSIGRRSRSLFNCG